MAGYGGESSEDAEAGGLGVQDQEFEPVWSMRDTRDSMSIKSGGSLFELVHLSIFYRHQEGHENLKICQIMINCNLKQGFSQVSIIEYIHWIVTIYQQI